MFGEVTTSSHTIRHMGALIQEIFCKIKSILHIEGSSIALHDPDNREFYFTCTVDADAAMATPDPASLRFADDRGDAGWVRGNGRAALVNDVSRDRRFFADIDARSRFTTRSMICVPLQTRKGFLGDLYALNKLDGEFSERGKTILEILSGSIAVSLENARLYGELKDHLHCLEREKRLLRSQALSGSARTRNSVPSTAPLT